MNNQPNRKRLLYLEIDQISSIIEVWRTKKRVTALVIIITLYIHPPLSFPRKNLNLPSYINRIYSSNLKLIVSAKLSSKFSSFPPNNLNPRKQPRFINHTRRTRGYSKDIPKIAAPPSPPHRLRSISPLLNYSRP